MEAMRRIFLPICVLLLSTSLLSCNLLGDRGNEVLMCEDPEITRLVLVQLVNEARAEGRTCGDVAYGSAPPIVWHSLLENAALTHSIDMARGNFFAHEGSDGSTVGVRVTREGYEWQAVGENLSAGRETSEAAVESWLESPDHCRALMNPAYQHMGAACVRNSTAQYGTYWTQVFGTPHSIENQD